MGAFPQGEALPLTPALLYPTPARQNGPCRPGQRTVERGLQREAQGIASLPGRARVRRCCGAPADPAHSAGSAAKAAPAAHNPRGTFRRRLRAACTMTGSNCAFSPRELLVSSEANGRLGLIGSGTRHSTQRMSAAVHRAPVSLTPRPADASARQHPSQTALAG